MRATILTCAAVAALVGLTVPAVAGDGFWTTSYPYGGSFGASALAIDPSDPERLYAHPTWRGLYRSEDGGASWQARLDERAPDSFDTTQIGFVVVDGAGDVFIRAFEWVTGRQALWRSSDGGATWEAADPGVMDNVTAFAIAPTDDGERYLGTQNGQLWRSSDGGATWVLAAGGGVLPAEPIRTLEIDPGDPLVAFLGAQASGVFKTTDGGFNWANVNANVTMTEVVDVAIDPVDPQVVYAADNELGTGKGIFKSTNGGGSWTKLGPFMELGGNAGRLIAIDPADPLHLYAVAGTEILESPDGGATWAAALTADSQLSSVQLHPANPSTLFATSFSEGIFRSTDGGATWHARHTGIRGLNFPHSKAHSLAFDASDPSRLYAGGIPRGWRSPDAGGTWSDMDHPGGQVFSFVSQSAAPGTVYAASNTLWRSTDGGVTWADSGGFCGFQETDLVIDAADPDILYLAGFNSCADPDGVYKSVDGGVLWNLMNTGFVDPKVRSLAIDPNDANTLYAGVSENHGIPGIYKTTNGGSDWFQLGGGLPAQLNPDQIVVHPQDSNVVLLVGETTNGGLYRSDDAGANWTKLLDENASSVAVDPNECCPAGQTIYVGTWNTNGFYRSLDGGQTWALINTGLPVRPAIESVVVDPGNPSRVLLGTAGGVYEYTFAGAVELTVNNTGDSGPGSLRDAISQANQDGVPNVIRFEPKLAGATIALQSALPFLFDSGTTIDGDLDGDCVPDIRIDGSATPSPTQGLFLSGDGHLIRGLSITGFPDNGIEIGPGSSGQLLECNFVGVDLSGVGAAPNNVGIVFSSGSTGSQIGGDPATQGNVVSGNLLHGFQIVGSTANLLAGNLVGVAADGTTALGNGAQGLWLNDGSSGNVIGPGNVVAHNLGDGVRIEEFPTPAYPDFTALVPDFTGVFPLIDFTDDCGVFHSADAITPADGSGAPFTEHFGMRLTGTLTVDAAGSYTFELPFLDDQARIVIDAAVVLDASGGGPTPSATVPLSAGAHAFELDFFEGGGAARLDLDVTGPGTATFTTDGNAGGCAAGQTGLCGELFQLRVPTEGNRITANSIFDNGGLGIAFNCCCGPTANDPGDLDVGPNTVLNFPELTGFTDLSGGSFAVDGTAPPDSTVEVFAADPDPTGFGEGETLLASVVADGGGFFSVEVTLPPGAFAVTATATDAAGNTSEFSPLLATGVNVLFVDSAADSGPGTLRDAIGQANADGAPTDVVFAPVLDGQIIVLQSPLPALTADDTTIDGDRDGDCRPDVALDGTSAGGGSGLRIRSSRNRVRGLALYGFQLHGIFLDGSGGPAADNFIECNYLGTDLAGTTAHPNSPAGVGVDAGASGNRIGPGNVIAGNAFTGIEVTGSHGNQIVGNRIGIDAAGSPLPNPRGVALFAGSTGNVVGGAGADGNLILGTTGGIEIADAGTSGNHVDGNTIGWPEGTAPPAAVEASAGATARRSKRQATPGSWLVEELPVTAARERLLERWLDWRPAGEGRPAPRQEVGDEAVPQGFGVRITAGAAGNQIGNVALGFGNEITNNGGAGVRLDGGDGSDGNAVRGNSIHANGGLGIDLGAPGVSANDAGDLDSGPNEGMNFPVLTRAVTDGVGTTVEGQLDTAAPGTAVVDVYVSLAPDPSGFGEGETLLGTTGVDPSGGFVLTPQVAVPAGSWVTATATDAAGNTSELSAALRVQGPTAPAAALVATPESSSSVRLGWRDPNAGETGFRIERSFDGAGWGPIDSVGPNVISYLDTGLGPATLVYYRVVALSGAGDAAPSNVAAAVTHAGVAAEVCRRELGVWHGGGRFAGSVAWNGSQWAAAWPEQRDGGRGEIYFQMLAADGSPAGAPLQVTEDDMPSQIPTLRWNGSSFGLLYLSHIRGPGGEVPSLVKFARLDGAGNLVRREAVLELPADVGGGLNNNLEDALVWNGADWGWFHTFSSPAPADVLYTRVSEDGEVLAGPIALTATPDGREGDVSAAWNGAEYGVAWIRRQGSADFRVLFQRVQADGTLLGGEVELWQNGSGEGTFYTDVVWDGAGWAVVWTDFAGDEAVYLQRLDAAASPIGGPSRLSDDLDPAFPPEDGVPVFDEIPDLFLRPGGGYVVFTSSFLLGSGTWEIGRLEADASGARVGSRTILSSDDGVQSLWNRAATDGASFLVTWQERDGLPDVVVDAGGSVVSGPSAITVYQSPGEIGFQSTRVAPVGEGFVAFWVDSGRLFAEIYDGAGAMTAQHFPLSATTGVGGAGLVGLGDTFAVAWRDDTGTARFARYDAAGSPLFGEVAVDGTAGGGPTALAFSGEVYGVVWARGGKVRFQKVAPDGTLLGPQVAFATGVGGFPAPAVQWVGSGWAVVWRSGGNLFFARLDAAGAVAVAPTQLTFGGRAGNDYDLLWTGEVLGLAWPEGAGAFGDADVYFTVLDREGTKAFPEKAVVAAPAGNDTSPRLTWHGDRFRLAFLPGELGVFAVREIEVLADGTVLPGTRLLDNHGGALDTASNGATTALLHQHLAGLGDALFSTTACLDDATPPDPPALSGGFDGQKVSLGWSASGDPESGILGYNLYRDGELLAENLPTTLGFDDLGPAPDTLYRYDVRALNGAFLESPADPASTLFVATGAAADLEVAKGDDPDPVLAGNPLTYTLTVTNHGPDTADGVTLTDTLPPEAVFVSSSPGAPACAEAGGVVTCGLGTLGPGAQATVTVTVTVDPAAAGTITNHAAVDAVQADPVPSNDQVSEPTAVETALPGATALVATALSSSSIRLSWQDPNGGELGFRLERSLDGVAFAPFHSVGANVTTFTDSGRPAGTLHYYRVVAFDGLGDAAPSNVAAATTFPAAAAEVCRRLVGRSPEWARFVSVAHDGTGWAAVWQERSGGIEDELYFQRLDADGAPTGSAVRITDRDGPTRFPKLVWNGSRFGVLWGEHMRTAEGSAVGDLFFALLAADGTKLRGDVRVFSHDQTGFLTDALEPGAFLWDGSGWAIVSTEGIDPPSDLHFYRLDDDGDLLTAAQLTMSGDGDYDPSLAWNGAEYGLAWLRQRDDDYRLFFQRMDTDGTLLGSPILVWGNPSNRGTLVTSTVWDGAGWAVAFMDIDADGNEVVYLARLDAAGNLLGPPQRISDAEDPAAPGSGLVFDEIPHLVNKPGGGYLIFTSSFVLDTFVYEIGRLEADPTGAKVGARTILSDADGQNSIWNRVATDGTDFLVGYTDHRLGTQEVATVLIDAAGTVLAGPSDVTTGHDPGNTFFTQGPAAPAVAPLGEGFAALWTDSSSGSSLLQAEIFDGAGSSVATRFPLSTRDVAGLPALVPVGDTFAVAWKDASTNDLLFDRYDATGLSLLGAEVTVTTTASHRGVGMDFSGEAFGLVWFDGNQMTFRRVAADGTLLGSPVAILGTGVGPAPQVRWVGSGWALLWRDNADNHLYYALLDGDGDLLVPPIQVTFTSSRPNQHRLLWTGEHLGLVWQENRGPDPPGSQVFFTVLGLDGFKAFPEVAVADGFGNPDLYWAGDRFRVVYRGAGALNHLREVEVLPDGTVLPGSRLLSNHQGPVAVASNGVTTGVLYSHFDMSFETTACLEDATGPSAPGLSTAFDGAAVQLSWTAAADPESGILTYFVYRDGSILAELLPTTLAFADGGFTPGATHSYEVRAMNGAYLVTASTPSPITPAFVADLSMTKTAAEDWANPGGTVTYSLTVESSGPHRMADAVVTDVLDPGAFDVAGATWTCVPDAGAGPWAACPPAGDAGDLASGVPVGLGAGDALTFTVEAELLPGADGSVDNTASVATPPGCSDPDSSDDSGNATVAVTLCPQAPDQVVANQVVSGVALFEACHTLTGGPALTVTGTGELTLRAGRSVVLADGFSVESGGRLVVEVDPALDPD